MRAILVHCVVWVSSLVLLDVSANLAGAQQPAVVQIRANTTVTVPNGATKTIASYATAVQARNEYGTPGLSKVPYLKKGFTNVGYGQSMQRSSISVNVRVIDLRALDEQMLKGK